jgi:hypothetical protein
VATDWVTISSLATAGATLALAISTFSATRSANRGARVAQEALLVGVRPLLVVSRFSDETQKIHYGDARAIQLNGGFGVAEVSEKVVYLAVSVRNAGQGIAVLRGWRLAVGDIGGAQSPQPQQDDFRRQQRDLYIGPADMGFWQGALREEDQQRDDAAKAIDAREVITIDVLYGDFEGGQRAITRFLLRPVSSARDGDNAAMLAAPGTAEPEPEPEPKAERPRWLASVIRHWSIDRPDPR